MNQLIGGLIDVVKGWPATKEQCSWTIHKKPLMVG
jgi:hypothetical protein